MRRKMVKSDLISSGHIWPGLDMAGYENLAGFQPGPDMISGATLIATNNLPTKFEVSISTHYEVIKGDTKCQKWGDLG